MNKIKSVVVLLAVLVLASMTSCKKEGVYTPTKKIQRVYASSFYASKHVVESWDWDDNLLESIDYYYSSGTLYRTEDFTYDGNRLIRVDDYAGLCYTTYEYDGSHLKSSNFYRRNNLEIAASYTYSENKLSQMVITYYNHLKGGQSEFAYLPFSAELNKAIDKCFAKASADNMEKRVMTLTLQFTWDGENIIKIVSKEDNTTVTIGLQYDNKKNPLQGFHCLKSEMTDEYNPAGIHSKNNITAMVFYYSSGSDVLITYTYQYDTDGYPTMVLEQNSTDLFNYQNTTYYEYE